MKAHTQNTHASTEPPFMTVTKGRACMQRRCCCAVTATTKELQGRCDYTSVERQSAKIKRAETVVSMALRDLARRNAVRSKRASSRDIARPEHAPRSSGRTQTCVVSYRRASCVPHSQKCEKTPRCKRLTPAICKISPCDLQGPLCARASQVISSNASLHPRCQEN